MADRVMTVHLGRPSVRAAEPRDVPRVAATLTLVQATSRWARWALPDDGRVQRLTRLAELDAGHRAVSTGSGWVTEDVTAVAAWVPPDGAPGTRPLPQDVRTALERELPHVHGTRWDAVRRTRDLVDAARPAGPHWWLAHLGTRPSSRRLGYGTALLQPALAHCDTTGLPAAAVVSTWAAMRFLRRVGFEVDRELPSADGALPQWLLVRPPAS
ncbi:GNAT family N-acetyltransferase [Geodermatophilus sp. DSM 44513]|uniref:GNAT family N-acetyltransferase n=1 Tax=Geodermatophilus sp. DSM 44513 TaxID=1528104 RepID=UPI00127E75F9|nr:GNAT family N-acetyltransferase [Geodermatophilus sp. DSM 44513]WNV77550.1 GNAT family N-acetyltransferase [Geodermatophilus sp. DSM 44513]